MRLGLPVALVLALGQSAFASIQSDVESVSAAVGDLDRRVVALEGEAIPEGPPVNKASAVARYQDYVYLSLIGQHKEAAEGFYGLVISGSLEDPTLQRDAEWQLAESLYAIGNLVTAESRFKIIADDANHPFRQDAVRNLLELYATLGDFDSFTALYEREIVQGRVQPRPEITYLLAKGFYLQGDLDRAARHFAEIQADSEWYGRARYFLGVVEIRKGQLESAPQRFQEAVNGPTPSAAARDAYDLSLLALARLAYERGEFRAAADFYQQIGGDSAYLADILYETVWSFIKQERYDQALQATDLFLLAFPEHAYNAELRVVQGHLFMGCAQFPDRCPRPPLFMGGDAFDQALSIYEQLVTDYAPIRDGFAKSKASDAEAQTFFEETVVRSTDDFGLEIPSYALAMIRAEPSMATAIDVRRSLLREEQDIAECEEMIAQIDEVLSRDGGIGSIGMLRFDAYAAQSGAVEQQIALIEAEARWLKGLGVRGGAALEAEVAKVRPLGMVAASTRQDASSVRDRVAVLAATTAEEQRKADALEEEFGEFILSYRPDMSDAERAEADVKMAAFSSRLDAQRQALRTARVAQTSAQVPPEGMTRSSSTEAVAPLRERMRGMRPGSQAAIGAQIDALHASLDRVQAKSGAVLDRIDNFAKTEYGQLQERFQREVVEVARERQDHGETSLRATGVSTALTRESLGRMEAFFAESVLKADMGVIDVYWSRKLELADERQRLLNERNSLVAELERRFQLIRLKMEQ